MALVAIVGFDCGLVRLFLRTAGGLGGLLAIGLAVSAGLVGLAFAGGRARRFAAGFALTAFVGAGLFYSAWSVIPGGFDRMWLGFVEPVMSRMPPWLPNGRWVLDVERVVSGKPSATVYVLHPTVGTLLVIEALMGLPVLAVALAGGVFGLSLHRPSHSKIPPDLA
jgi:hypothetical protein